MIWLALIIVLVTLAAALSVLFLENMLAAVAASFVVSLGVTVIFVILQAPDVAMTEGVVGAGFSGLILALALKRLGLWRLDIPRGKEGKKDA